MMDCTPVLSNQTGSPLPILSVNRRPDIKINIKRRIVPASVVATDVTGANVAKNSVPVEGLKAFNRRLEEIRDKARKSNINDEVLEGTTITHRGRTKCDKHHGVNEHVVGGPDDTPRWYQDNNYHRNNGPTMDWGNATRRWYQNPKHHKGDGPA